MKSTDFLKSKEIEFKTIKLKEVPRTAQDVERIYGCPLHQVLKTLVFVGEVEPIIVVLPGDKRVNLEKLEKITNQGLKMANPDEVKEITSYSIGGVCPFAIEAPIKKVIDKSVFDITRVNIGSGKAEIGIELESLELKKACDWTVEDIS